MLGEARGGCDAQNASQFSGTARRVLCFVEDGERRFHAPRYSAPASVNDRARVLRVKSIAPSSRSRAATMREADGWESPRSRAAREKLPERATRTKTRKADMRSVIESSIHSRDKYILVHPGLYWPSH